MTYKWFLIDWRDPQRFVVGELTNVHRSSFPSDGDTNLEITPDGPDPDVPNSPDFRTLLRGHVDGVVDQTVLECEINVGGDWQDHYEDWVRSLIDGTTDGKITAQGIWVEDLGHGSKTELHPMDVIFGSVEGSLLPGDWIGAVAARHGLVVGDSLLALRFAVASDDRQGEFQSAPPLAPYTRPVTFLLPFPAQPAGGAATPESDLRIDLQANATIEIGDPRPDPLVNPKRAGNMVLPVTVTCVAAYDDPAPGASDEGPGVLTGEIVTFWSSPATPLIAASPQHLSFGKVPVMSVVSLSTTILNVGAADLAVTVPAPPVGAFRWEPIAQTTIPAGGSLELPVDFAPRAINPAQGTLWIQSNAPSSPTAVALDGTGTKQIDPK
jgi:hypothetical protein